MALLRNPRGQGKFEASCIALHLAQARSNLDDLSRSGQSRAQRDSRSRLSSTPSLWNKTLDEAASGAPDAPQPTATTPSAGPGGATEPMFNSLPRDIAEGAGQGALGELGSSTGLAPMIASIAEGLHEELRGFLASFSSRLAAREAALAATCDRAATAGDYGMTELSKRLEDRLAVVAHSAAAEREAALDVVREALRRVRDEVTAQHARLESLVTGDDWGRQLREATRAFEQRSALRVEAVERHVEELRAKDAAGQRAWRDAVIQRVDAVEKRLSKNFKDSNSVLDQVGKMVPDVERLQSLYDALQADHAAADTWQRRLFSCEAAVQRLAALEAQSNLSERQSERFRDESSQSLRESLRLTGALAARVATLESSEKSRDEHWKAAEKRMLAVAEQNQKRMASGLDIVRENSQQRCADSDSKSQQRLDRLREDLEQRVTALSQTCKRDIHSLRLDVDKLGQLRPLPTGHAQASYTGAARDHRDKPTQSAGTATSATFISRTRTTCAPQFANQPPPRPATLVPAQAVPAVPIEGSNLPLHAPRAGDQSAQSLGTTTPAALESRAHLASEPPIAHLPSYNTTLLNSAHAATLGGSDWPFRTESAHAQSDAVPAEASAPDQQQEGSSGRSSSIGVDFNPEQMELEASRVFSDADEWAHASRESSAENAVPDHGQQGLLAAPAQKSIETGASAQAEMDDDEDDVEALMAQSMYANLQRTTVPGDSLLAASAGERIETCASAPVKTEDADEDVEALFATGMHANMQRTTVSGDRLLAASAAAAAPPPPPVDPPASPAATDSPARAAPDGDAEHDVEACIVQSTRANEPNATVSQESLLAAPRDNRIEPGTTAEVRMEEPDDDAEADDDVDIEALISGTINVDDDADAEDMHKSQSAFSSLGLQGTAGVDGPDYHHVGDSSDSRAASGNDNQEDYVEALMNRSIEKTQSSLQGTTETGSLRLRVGSSRDSRIPAAVATTAAAGAAADAAGAHGAAGAAGATGVVGGAVTATEADEDSDDVEALMTGSMRKSQSSLTPSGNTGVGSLRLRVGASTDNRRTTALATAPGVAASTEDDDGEDDVEALLAGSMQKSHSSLSSLALQGQGGMGSLRLRVGASTDSKRPAAAPASAASPAAGATDMAVDDDDDEDDVEALMAGSIQKAHSSVSPSALPVKAGVGGLRLRMGASDGGIGAVGSAAAVAAASSVSGAGNEDDDDDDEVEVLMAGSIQAGHAGPGRRRAADMHASSSTVRNPGVQASRQTGRDARLSALLGLDVDEDED